MSTNGDTMAIPGDGSGDDDSSQSASTSTLAFVAGTNENIDDRNSVFPDKSPNSVPVVPEPPIDDTLFYGDELPALPETLTEAVFATKEVDGLNGTYRQFRFKNSLQVDYSTTPDGGVDDDTITVTVNSQKDDDIVKVKDTTGGSTSKFKASLDLFLPGSPEPPSYTILADDWKQKSAIFKNVFDSQKKRVDTYRRYVKAEKGVFKNSDGTSMEGVRAATVWGPQTPILSY